MTSLEICVDSVESAMAAEEGGAQRVELCSALNVGGLTPSLGLIRAVRGRLKIAVHIMIRPREGDFVYTKDEFAVMREDVALAKESGADGVVLGLLTAAAEVDVERTRMLVQLARPMDVTFHRAIDMTWNMHAALEDVIRTGADRVLTSGGAATAMLGRKRIRELVVASGARIRVMACGAVRAENVAEVARDTKAMDFHAALRRAVPITTKDRAPDVQLGAAHVDDYARSTVRIEDVRALQGALGSALPFSE